jgi:hypothetical protein
MKPMGQVEIILMLDNKSIETQVYCNW